MTDKDPPVVGIDPAGVRHEYAGPGAGGHGQCICGWEPGPSWPLGGHDQFAVNAHVAWVCGITRPPHKRPVRTGQGISDDVLSRLADLSAQRVAHERALATLRAAQLPLIHEALAQARYGDMRRLMAATGYSREHLTEINTQRKAQDGSKT